MKTLIWFTQDLRTFDNSGLEWAIKQQHQISAIYCFDDETPINGPRFNFIQESLLDLCLQLNKLNIPLLVFKKHQQAEACRFIESHETDNIVMSKAHNFRKKIWQKSLENKFSRIQFHYFSHDTLLDLENFNLTVQDLPDVFTTFRKAVEQKWIVETPTAHVLPVENFINIHDEFKSFVFPEKMSPAKSTGFTGGRTSGLQRLKHYIWDNQAIVNYKETRNGMINFDDSSKFSPWLSLGCLSAKEIYWQIKDFENRVKKNDSTYWLIFELLWRDYFKFLAEKYQQKIFVASGLHDISIVNLPESSETHSFLLWKNAVTEDPFINANMIELATTGWMSNRGRQNVANYLVKTLKIDWTLGARWFEENLIDYDVESNWGNWLYQSGLGTDPRNRIFNPQIQSRQYDPAKAYENKWLLNRGLK